MGAIRGKVTATVVAVGVLCLWPSVHWAEVAVAAPLPHFELQNWDGQLISSDSLRGKRAIVAFTYAKCVIACPMITSQLKLLDDELGQPADLEFVHISVNPSVDSPGEILAHFAKHDIDPRRDRRWLFLRGADDDVAAVLERFGITVKRTQVAEGELIEHTIMVLVVGRDGRVRASFDTYYWDEEDMLDALRS